MIKVGQIYKDGSPYNFAHSVSPVEIIGNIHENADLLEVGGK